MSSRARCWGPWTRSLERNVGLSTEAHHTLACSGRGTDTLSSSIPHSVVSPSLKELIFIELSRSSWTWQWPDKMLYYIQYKATTYQILTPNLSGWTFPLISFMYIRLFLVLSFSNFKKEVLRDPGWSASKSAAVFLDLLFMKAYSLFFPSPLAAEKANLMHGDIQIRDKRILILSTPSKDSGWRDTLRFWQIYWLSLPKARWEDHFISVHSIDRWQMCSAEKKACPALSKSLSNNSNTVLLTCVFNM